MRRPASGRKGLLRERLADDAGRLDSERYPGELWRELAPRLWQARPGAKPAAVWFGAGRWLVAAAASVLLAVLAVRQGPWSAPPPGAGAAPTPAVDTAGTAKPGLKPDVEPEHGLEQEPGRGSAGAAAAAAGATALAMPDPRAAFGSLRPPGAGFVPRPPTLAPPPLGRGLSLGAAALGRLQPPSASVGTVKEERR